MFSDIPRVPTPLQRKLRIIWIAQSNVGGGAQLSEGRTQLVRDVCVELPLACKRRIKPAKQLGMQTIKVTEPSLALAELEAIVGIPLR